MLITSLNLRIKRGGARTWFDGEMTVNLAFFISLCTQGFFFIDVLLFHVHSTVPFFPQLVTPVRVSMEEPVLKTKAESTSVNVVVDGEETIAKKRQVAAIINIIYLWLERNPEISTGITLRCSIRNIMHEWRIPYFGKTNACAITNESVELVCATTKMTKFVCKILYGVLKIYMKK